MSQRVAYWDSSALIPLCVPQPQSIRAVGLYESYNVVTLWVTKVEMISGLTRLERMGQISHDQFLLGKQLAWEIEQDWIPVGSSASTAPLACALLEAHPLRAADALQVAAALDACNHKPLGYVFVTADQRQAEAARKSGFSVEFI
jgi:predicted nucleic acid-binding protein